MKTLAPLSLLTGALLLTGCIGNNDDDPVAAKTSVTVAASLGAIKNAPFRVFALDGTTEIAPAGTTNPDGSLPVLNLPAGQPFILEIRGAVGATYFDEAKGADVPFTSGSLHVAAASPSASLGVSILTEAAYQRALKLGAGTLSVSTVNAANQSVSQAFGLADITSAPALVGSSAQLNSLTANQAGQYAARLAALAQLALNTNAADATPALTLASQLAKDFSDGLLDGKQDAAAIGSLIYAPGTFAADWNTALATATSGITDPGAKATLASLAGPALQLPFIPVASSGLPAAGNYAAKTNINGSCSVNVSGATASLTAAGQTISVTLDGSYFESSGQHEVGHGVFVTGTTRLYPGATISGADLKSVDLHFDSSGKLVFAYASHITDSSPNPAAGTNTQLFCAGDGFTGNLSSLPDSGLNTGPTSQFTATALVGTYNAPLNANGSGACTFSLDNQGNFSITTASVPNGKLDVPFTALQAASQTATSADYELTTGGVRYTFMVQRLASGETRTNFLTDGSNSKTCSTANDPSAKWTAFGSHAGTFTGHTQTTGTADMTNGFNHNCALTIAADGTATYTASTGATIVIGPNVSGASIGTSTNNQGQLVDYLDRGNAAMSFYFTGKNVTATDNFTLYDVCTWQ